MNEATACQHEGRYDDPNTCGRCGMTIGGTRTVSPSPEQLSERLRRKNCMHWPGDACGKSCIVNPDGPEAADALESAQAEIAGLTTVLQGVREPSPVSTMDYATLDTPIGNTTKGGPKQSLTLRQWLEADNRTPQFRARLMALCIIERQQAALAALKGNRP